MPSNRTEPSTIAAADPGSDRLTPDDVIAIHRAHLAGTPWAEIARQYDTHRRHIGRIVQGRRWRRLHPTERPDLYVAEEVPRPASKVYDAGEIERALDAFRRELGL